MVTANRWRDRIELQCQMSADIRRRIYYLKIKIYLDSFLSIQVKNLAVDHVLLQCNNLLSNFTLEKVKSSLMLVILY